MTIPNLAGVATANLVEKIGTGKFSASYINWSRTMALLREHAPDWQPELVPAPDGYILHQAPVGAYLLIRFRNGEMVTPPVPQAVMDTRNAAIPVDRITARDITDTHRRGVCMAAAFTFGLAYELWAKLPLESGYAEAAPTHKPTKGALVNDEQADQCAVAARDIQERMDADDIVGAFEIYQQFTDSEERVAIWDKLPAPTRRAIKAHGESLKEAV